MANYKLEPTAYPNIYEYVTKKGKRFAVRIGFTIDGVPDEFQKMGLKTLSEARSLLRKVEDNIEQEEAGLIKNKGITVREYYPIFKKEKVESKAWNKTSVTGNDSLFANHILPDFGETPLIKLNRIKYQEFINRKIYEEEFSVKSVESFNNAFMSMLNHAVLVGVLERNRLKRIKIGKDDYVLQKKHLTMNEYDKFMKTAEEILTDQVHYCMVYLTTFGMRRGEIMGLTAKNIEFRERDGFAVIHIETTRTNAYPEGKGTKNASSRRIIPLDLKATELVRFALNEAAEIKKDYGEILHKDDFIFINPVNCRPFHINYLNVLMDRVGYKSGIKCSPHMMRHTFATIAQIEGVDARLVADYLGHKNTSMTEHYSHPTAEGMDKVVDLMSKRNEQ